MHAVQQPTIGARVKRRLSGLWTAFNRLPDLVMDGLFAVIALAVNVATIIFDAMELPDRTVTATTYLLTVAITLPVAFRRRWPLEALLVATATAIVYQLVESPTELEAPQTIPLILLLYAVAAYDDRRRRGLALSFFAVELMIGINVGTPLSGRIVAESTWVLLSIVVGAAVRGRRERAKLAEQSRREDALRMVNEERLRIARELHDVVAHSIATISVQAGMATHVFDTQPEQARAALKEIRAASKDALQEIRATLGLLRSSNGSDGSDDRAPAPHLDQLGDLVARTESGGVRVSLTTSGTPRPLPTRVDITAYRVVQEALTNVVRHAGADAKVTVSIDYSADAIELGIVDSGPRNGLPATPSSTGSQLGLIGMRERVASVGGELVTGPRPTGGFEVRARLPLGDTR